MVFPTGQHKSSAYGDLLSTPRTTEPYSLESQTVIPLTPMLDPRLKVLAQKIDRLVKASSYSPAELSRLLGVDRSAVSKWMSGDRTPTMKNLLELAEVLNIEMAELWTGPEAIPATPEMRLMMDRMGDMTAEQQQALLALAAAAMGLGTPKKG